MIHPEELLPHTKNLYILFVEDHKELRESAAQMLQNFFEKVTVTNNGKEALALYEKNNYDIVLSDLKMPLMDGVLLSKKILARNPDQKIIILSAYDESEYLIELINLGISHFIKKPIDSQELLKVLYKISKSIRPQVVDSIRLDANYSYNREKKHLLYNSTSLYLTKFEIIFLDILTTQCEKIFSNEEIVNYFVKNDEKIEAQNIRKLVSKLRKKLPENSIESIYGAGYRILTSP